MNKLHAMKPRSKADTSNGHIAEFRSVKEFKAECSSAPPIEKGTLSARVEVCIDIQSLLRMSRACKLQYQHRKWFSRLRTIGVGKLVGVRHIGHILQSHSDHTLVYSFDIKEIRYLNPPCPCLGNDLHRITPMCNDFLSLQYNPFTGKSL